MKIQSMRGEWVDFTKYMAQNEEAIAVGNANMNARGDIIGPGGKVVKKREDIAAEYHAANPNAVKKVSIKDLAKEVLPTPAEVVKEMRARAAKPAETQTVSPAEAVAAAPTPAPEPKKRKIVDSE